MYLLFVMRRGVGCIFYEMAFKRPLFPGSSVEDQLHLIFSILGTPEKDCWPNVEIPSSFPKYTKTAFTKISQQLDDAGVDLLERFLRVSFRFGTKLQSVEGVIGRGNPRLIIDVERGLFFSVNVHFLHRESSNKQLVSFVT